MSDNPEPPMVVRVIADTSPKLPRPGFAEAAVLTIGYWIALIGSMMLVIVPVVVAVVLQAKAGDPPQDLMTNPGVRASFAWSFPAGYLGGLLFSVIVLRVVLGRSWMHDLGLERLPAYHLALGLVALPGFVILSDALGQFIQPLDTFIFGLLGFGKVDDPSETIRVMFQDFHWSFAVFAIGIGPGLVEELWCRGFVGRGLIGRHGWFAGIALTSLFFGVLHLWPPSYVIVTAIMGAGLHFTYVASRSLWVPIVMHLFNNSFAALGTMKVISTDRMDAAMLVQPAPIIVAAVCLLLFCGLAMWHSRWTWPGEQPGILIPPEGSEIALTQSKPDWIYTIASVGFCAALIGLLFA